MVVKYLNDKTEPFKFIDNEGNEQTYVLIFGDEVEKLSGGTTQNAGWTRVRYRGREGEMKRVLLTDKRTLEMYFLDVSQGDAAFIVTPKPKNILIDGGMKKEL